MQAIARSREVPGGRVIPTDGELVAAVLNGKTATVQQALACGLDTDRVLPLFNHPLAPLHAASWAGQTAVVQLLIRAQANVDLQLSTGASPLYIAAQEGHLQVAELLVGAQANVNLPDFELCTPLYLASQAGYLRVVKLLVKAKADIDCQVDTGSTPLYMASQMGHPRVVDFLLKSNADFRLQTVNGSIALDVAAQQGHYSIVELLVAAGADVNHQRKDGTTAIYLASQNGHHGVVNLLVNSQADVNLRQGLGASPLYIAAQNGHLAVIELLVKANANVNVATNMGVSPLYIACERGHRLVATALLKAQADTNLCTVVGRSPLTVAVLNGHNSIIEMLIGANAKIGTQTEKGESPLFLACQRNNMAAVEALLKGGAAVNQQTSSGQSPLYTASQNGFPGVIDLLIAAGADVNLQTNSGSFPLYIASQNGQHQIVKLLIRVGADVNLYELDGCTALFVAAQKGHRQIVDTLIEAQADVNIQSHAGASPLFIAAQNDHQEVVASLIKGQAAVDLRECNGCPALYIAAQNGHCRVAELLIKGQAGINLQNNFGTTPLLVASACGHADLAFRLIEAGADVNLQDAEGTTPLFMASQNGNHRLVEELLRAGADAGLIRYSGESPVYIAQRNNLQQVLPLLRAALNETAESQDMDNSDDVRDFSSAPVPAANQSVSAAEVPSDPELSRQLHAALTESGFVSSRAALQGAVADVLEKILRNRVPYDSIYVLGSYSEGWGNSLVRVNGLTDWESDIDMMLILQGRLHHLKGGCNCVEGEPPVDYSDGHLLCPGFASNPAKPLRGSSLRPAVDIVETGKLCCYPPIAPLLPERVQSSRIPKPVLKALEAELDSSPCHVVHAAPSGEAGKQLRVSTTFLERRLLRSLSSLQGQLFVTLKYLVKKVICHKEGYNVQGLKAYHVKTATFRMVEKTPAEDWRPENLVELVRRSLKMLLDSAEENCHARNTNAKIMEHFFLCDAALYLKGLNSRSPEDVSRALQDVIRVLQQVLDDLPSILQKFMSQLKPLDAAGTFFFHPFLILPDIRLSSVSDATPLQYHEIYSAVRQALLDLARLGGDLEVEEANLNALISRLPECALSAREALRAMACLKFGHPDAAVEVLQRSAGHKVSRTIPWPLDRDAAVATDNFVWRHLTSCDSAWKFCFEFDNRPAFPFLPKVTADNCILNMDNYKTYFYINFDALLQSLRLELIPADMRVQDWLRGVALREDADVHELTVALEFCREPELRDRLTKMIAVHVSSLSLKKSWRDMLFRSGTIYPE